MMNIDAEWIKAYMIFHIYFIQCIFYGFTFSLYFTYSYHLDWAVIALFAASDYPYSLKFFFAPIQEKIYFRLYGKRKSWIVGSLFVASLIVTYMSTIVTKDDCIDEMLICLTMLSLTSAINDVSTDALGVQIIKDSATLSKVNFMGQQFGKIITSSIFLMICFKGSFTEYLGLQQPIIQPSSFMIFLAIFVLLTALTIHVFFKENNRFDELNQHQQEINNQKQIEDEPWSQILKHYLHFVHLKYSVCRQSIAMIFLNFGLLFFISSYKIELINKEIIQSQFINMAQDANSFCLVFLIIIFGKYVKPHNMHKFKQILTGALLITCIIVYMLDFQEKYSIAVAYWIIWFIYGFQYYVMNIIMNELSKGRFTGITITSLLSLNNYCNDTFIQKEIINYFGFDWSAKAGFLYTASLVIALPYIDSWIKRGLKIKAKEERQ